MRWTRDELAKIDCADDLKIVSFREDGAAAGTLTWLWEVAFGLFVGLLNNRSGDAYRAHTRQVTTWFQ
ncbi:hypothetical protein LPH50_08420 [Xylella taiwanensis]|uniref:Uncharacterized protein n=1 Tax=Xylella taiwanensis TaxID=1444770 RepID=A0ABS8TVT3_9GAMM|nr:hypothetical protein [Xylella taiwanensis]MCD8455968.1 hypothetical protein [Xylella taiwanensis]MCD8458372.1 hypothetical protein [Xylella taiwanensis]MCD8460509.1 hypothetical protein [Xylella taiwanensis]MCD8463430.1 hypothetical protein [Xylella taiwanensis]MCD8465013.1 hypothetical protein [Xylella taiwanensis]